MQKTYLLIPALIVFLTACAPGFSVRGTPVPLVLPPVYTPAGTGLRNPPRTRGLPVLPLTPNKRPLPPTREPSIWAADEPAQPERGPAATPVLYGVEVPYPPHTETEEDKMVTLECVASTADVLASTGVDPKSIFSAELRKCFLMRMFRECSNYQVKLAELDKKAGKKLSHADRSRRKALQYHAFALAQDTCRGVRIPNDVYAMQDAAAKAWHRIDGLLAE